MSTSSAKHIFEMLRLIGGESRPLGATEARRRLGLSLTTAHRALATLEQAGYVARHQSSTKYVLGDMSRALLQSFLSRFPLRSVALPYMQRLAVMSGDTTSLFVPLGWYVVRIASVKGTNEVIHTGPIGETLEMGRNAAGRVLFAALPPDERARCPASLGEDDEIAYVPPEPAHGGHLMVWNAARGQCQLAFPVLGEGGAALGAVAIEGGSRLTEAAQSHGVDPYLQVVGQLSHALSTGSRKVVNPYAHLDPDAIRLPPGR